MIGRLYSSLSGQSHLNATGTFTRVKLSASGQSKITTKGDVSGDYNVNMSGQSNGRHTGKIEGDFDKDCSGQSHFSNN